MIVFQVKCNDAICVCENFGKSLLIVQFFYLGYLVRRLTNRSRAVWQVTYQLLCMHITSFVHINPSFKCYVYTYSGVSLPYRGVETNHLDLDEPRQSQSVSYLSFFCSSAPHARIDNITIFILGLDGGGECEARVRSFCNDAQYLISSVLNY